MARRMRNLMCVSLMALALTGGSGCMYVTAAKVTYKVAKFAAKKIKEDKARKASQAMPTESSQPKTNSGLAAVNPTPVVNPARDQQLLDAQ